MDDFSKTRNGGQGYVHKSPGMFSSIMSGVGNMFKPATQSKDSSPMTKLANNRRTTQQQLDQLK